MIRTLHKYLEIPLELLIGEQKEESFELTFEDINWSKFPFVEMIKRKWITSSRNDDNLDPREIMADFLKPIGSLAPQSIMWRRTLHSRVEKDTDQYALLAWAARVMILAQKIKVDSYDKNLITIDFLKELAKLSQFSQGPLLAIEMLSKKGIKIIFQKQLPKTNIDGGCFLDTRGHPVIGMTLRYDRIDNFWYTLLHEIAHIYKHLTNDKDLFIDNLKMESQKDQKEKEADKIAREAFIPRTAWERSDALIFRTKSAILEFSKKFGIHPAIVAGRIRYETKDYSQFSDLIGEGEIKNILKGYVNE